MREGVREGVRELEGGREGARRKEGGRYEGRKGYREVFGHISNPDLSTRDVLLCEYK